MSDISELRNRFERLIDRLEQGCVVPFVGAGISQEARKDGDEAFKPKASAMQESLSSELAKIPDHDDLIQSLISNHDLEIDGMYRKCKKNGPGCNKIGNHIEGKKHVSLDRLAEVHAWLHGEENTCKVVNINKFAELKPLHAHQYLACLAREGLITEIISTNYDCCIEKAFTRSFLPDAPEDPNDDPLAVIRDLPEYREYGGRLKIADSLQRPVLHLYKINGCADRYAVHSEPSRIILTEKQLQNFRDDKWAQDLLADRARRRNLLFCGFGSEEPQVRHTALAISNEFHVDRNNPRPLDDIYKLPNAPFLSTYRQPSFAQLQIMVSHIRAHMTLKEYRDLEVSAKINSWLGNIFSGKDARYLGAASDELNADLFFKRLYQAAFGRLLARHTQKDSVFFHWISNLTSQPASWCSYLRERIFPCEDNSAKTGTNLVDQSYFSTLPCLFEPSKHGILLLWRFLWAMKYPDKKLRDDSLWYLPLREDPIFILTTLLLLLGLVFKDYAQPRDYCPIPPSENGDRFGIAIRDDDNGGTQPLTVYLVHRFARYRVLSQSDQQFIETKSRIIRVISVPGESFHKRKERFTHELPPANGDKALFVGSRYRIDAEDLISLAGTPENMPNCMRKIFSLSGKSKRRVGLKPSD